MEPAATLTFEISVPVNKTKYFFIQVRRLESGEVNGAKPCIVSFAAWKDKENVLRQAKLLKGCGIYITEDVSSKPGV